MKKYKCLIHDTKPDLCRRYPEKGTGDILVCCSYSLNENGELEGECNRCGQCCFLVEDLMELGSIFVMGDPCPYLMKD